MKRLCLLIVLSVFFAGTAIADPAMTNSDTAKKPEASTQKEVARSGPRPSGFGKLQLTKEQKMKWKQTLQGARLKYMDMRKRARDISTQLQPMMMSNKYDEAKVAKLADSMGDLTKDWIKFDAKVKNQQFKLLTPGQREMLQKIKAARR